jgi:hypothetical protein
VARAHGLRSGFRSIGRQIRAAAHVHARSVSH